MYAMIVMLALSATPFAHSPEAAPAPARRDPKSLDRGLAMGLLDELKKNAKQELKGAKKEAEERARQKAREAQDAARAKAKEAQDSAQDNARAAREAVQESAGAAQGPAQNKVQEARDAATQGVNAVGSIKQKVEDKVDVLLQKASLAGEEPAANEQAQSR